jgi:hypothetical protein
MENPLYTTTNSLYLSSTGAGMHINEDSYFMFLQLEQRKKREEERNKQIAEDDRKKMKDLHYMHCPKCGMDLHEIDYKGIRIDKCYHCDGIWLDAGELDSIAQLEKSTMTRLFSIFKS